MLQLLDLDMRVNSIWRWIDSVLPRLARLSHEMSILCQYCGMSGEYIQPARLVAEWSYTPSDFLQDELEIWLGAWRVKIGEGRVNAEYMDRPIPEAQETAEIGRQIESALKALQPSLQRTVDVRGPSVTTWNMDGTKVYGLRAEFISSVVLVSDNVDIIVRDKNGTVIGDSRAERTARQCSLALLAATHTSDGTLQRLIDSFETAVGHRGRLAAHLFEMIEHLEKEFGSRRAAAEALGSSASSAMQMLGRIANAEPLTEGRHPGKHRQPLRTMSPEESAQALRQGEVLVETYLRYLGR